MEKLTLVLGVAFGLILAKILYTVIYNIYFHPLSKFPGSKKIAASNLTFWYITWRGDILPWVRRQHELYGEVVRLGSTKLSYITPQAWKDLNGHRVSGRLENSKDSHFYIPNYNGEHDIISTPDTAEHGRLRKIFSNAFSDRALKLQEPLIRKYADALIEGLHREAKEKPGSPQDLVKWFNCTTFDIIADLVLGEPLGLLENSELSPWVHAVFGQMKLVAMSAIRLEYPFFGKFFNLFLPRSVTEQAKMHFQHTAERVDKRLSVQGKTSRPDIWNLVLEKAKDHITVPKMYANASVFMVGGSETTATLMSGLTYLFLQNPDKLQKAVEEVRALSEDQLTFDHLPRLQYLQACFEEALRWYPPVPAGLPREIAKGGNPICGEWIPGGTSVYVSQQAAYRSSLNFKDPDAFIPERWLPGSSYDDDRKEVMQPFSFGPRNCLGKNLAYHEMRLIMSKILWNFDLVLCPQSENWAEQKCYLLWQKPELWVKLKPIHAPMD